MDAKQLIFPPGATRHDWVLDIALAAGLGLLTVPPYGVRGFAAAPTTLQFLSAVLMIGSLVWRRHAPLLALAGVSAAAALQLAVSTEPMATLVAVPVMAYSVARWIPGRQARIVVLLGGIGAVAGPLRWIVDDPSYISLRDLIWLMLAFFVCLGVVVTPYAIGRRVRESSEAHRHRVEAAEERYRTMLNEREQEARLAESRARTQIARELHDIVAHSLSVMIVQAEGGRAAAGKRPQAATEALTTIAETGREALSEMRRILGVLRAEPETLPQADFTPSPRLTDIPELVARTSDRVRLAVHGQPPRVSPALELTIYRVVQEALTNFLKHAGPEATASVSITYGMREIHVDVIDNGVAAPGMVPQNPGHGLRGMNERISAMGGRLLTRARPNGGFQVTAVLPVPAGTTPQEGDHR